MQYTNFGGTDGVQVYSVFKVNYIRALTFGPKAAPDWSTLRLNRIPCWYICLKNNDV